MTYEKKMPTKQGFYSWFQKKKDPYLVAQYRYLFFEIDKYCNRTKAIGAGLFDPLSQERVLQIQRVMENDKWYRIFHKKELEEIRKAFRFILEYLQGLDAENTKALAKSAADKVKSDESLKEENHRDEPPLEKETPPAPAPAPVPASVQIKKPDVRRKQKTYFQDDKEAFFLWLGKDKKIPEQDRKRIISAISISEMYLQDNISARFALFSKDAGLVRESISVLLADSIFRTRNEERQGKYYTALQKLEEYNNERDPNYLPGAESEKRPTNYEQEALPKTADNKAHEGSLPEKPDAGNCIDTVEAIPSTNDSDAKVEKEIDEEQHINETSTVDHSASDSAPTLCLSDQIETILRVECEKNPYGTTVAFIKGKIPNARLTEIKDILTTAAWAKSEMGAWKYVIPTISSSEQKDVAEDPIDEYLSPAERRMDQHQKSDHL